MQVLSDDLLSYDTMTTTPTYGNSCFPFAVNCRFSKAFLGVPKRCGYCQKMIVGTGFTCQNCSFKCHKRCIMIGHGNQVYLRPKPCSLSKLPPGDDLLIAKLLRESEINCNDMTDSDFVRKDDRSQESNGNLVRRTESSSAKVRRVSRPMLNQSSFNTQASSLPNDDPCCSLSLYSTSTTTSPSLMSQPSSPAIFPRRSQRSRRETVISNSGSRRPSGVLVNSVNTCSSSNTDEKRQATPASGIMGRIFRLFPAWSPNWSKNGENSSRSGLDGSNASLQSVNSRRTSLFKSTLLKTKSTPTCHQIVSRVSTTRSHQGSPVVSSAREFNRAAIEKLYARCEDRRKSAHEFLLTSTHYSPRQNPNPLLLVEQKPAQNGTCPVENRDPIASDWKPPSISPLLQRFRLRAGIQEGTTAGGHKFLRNHESDPIKVIERRSVILRHFGDAASGKGPGQNKNSDDDEVTWRERLANTWPLSGKHIDYDEFDRLQSDENEKEGLSGNGSPEEDTTCEDVRYRPTRLSDLGEWTIPYTDLVLSECLHECRTMTTYRGRWHGDVMIHTYDICKNGGDHLIRGFLEEVRTLTKIRHENVALFMGASVEAPLLAVVTSIHKGCNLYEAVHLENRRLAQNAKVNIARQVAQGMGYLHAKGIILKTLTSKSIYLECKVKISMVDDGAPLKRHDRPNMGCIRRGHLTYMSPELMQKLWVTPPALTVGSVFSKESDVYAFGTTLFEMFANNFPFSDLCPDAIVWAIGTGRRQQVDNLQCTSAMKGLIEECWSSDPAYRPSFTEILKGLQHASGLHKKHCSSVPEKLNRAGLHRSPYNF